MPFQVLARKYRPQRFADVIGQEHVTRTLLNALAQGRIAHGYIFSGHRGIGKTTIARILAAALNCRTAVGTPERPTPEPCLQCDSCLEVRAGNAVDVIEIDAATNRGIDEIRELRDAARYAPARDRYKIYILDEAHQITDAAFNALLKTLEEPPAHVVFMMATTEPEDIPQTIRSRCQHYSFHAVRFDDIVRQLGTVLTAEQIGFDEETLALLAEAGDGSMRDALSITDQAIASAELVEGKPRLQAAQVRELMGTVPNAVFERLLEAVGENQSAPIIEEVHRLLDAGKSAAGLARQFVRYLRNVLMAKIAGEGSELLQVSPDERARAARSALLFSEEDLTRFLQVMLRTFDELNYRQEPRFHLELGLLKLVHLQRLLPVEQILSQLGGAGAGGSARGAASTGGQRGGGSSASAASQPTQPRVTPPQSAPAPERPAFSPFEQDAARRKGPRESEAPAAPPQPAPPAATAPPELPAPPPPLERTVAGPDELGEVLDELAAPELAAPETEASTPDEPSPAPAQAAASSPTLDALRHCVCDALEAAGHSTAAALVAHGVWTDEGETVRVEVPAKKTMLGLTLNAEADKLCREALRKLTPSGHKPRTLVFVPGTGVANGGGTTAPAPAPRAGSVQALAMENPLVREAQELFRGEIRSVLDLRDNK